MTDQANRGGEDWLIDLDHEAETKHRQMPQGETPWDRFTNSGTYRKVQASAGSITSIAGRVSLPLMTNREFMELISNDHH